MSLLDNLRNRLEAYGLWPESRLLVRNEYLKTSGTTDTNLYYIVSGSLRIYFEDANEEHTIRLGYGGNFIGALDSFITEQPSELVIQAIKRCEIKVLPKREYTAFMASDPANQALWMRLTEALIVQQLEREKDILTASPAERYQRVLARSPQVFQEVPHKYIASYLRMTPETLSRIKKS